MPYNCISIIGLGYIGLPTAAVFASRNKQVIGVDISQHVVDTINAGKVQIVEPGLELMVEKAVNKGFLRAVIAPEPADVFLIAVPSPFLARKSNDLIPKPDLSYIESAARAIAKVLKKGDVVILESTSPVGTTEKMAEWISEERSDLTFPQTHGAQSDIRIAYCPERVLPGNIISELIENDRVIGGMTESCSKAAIDAYRVFVKGNCVKTNSRTAEMTKLTENASRDVGIALANELSIICDSLDIDVWELISLANLHPRVSILQPGPGVGGHCIAVDPWFIASKSPDDANLIKEARIINDKKPFWVLEKVNLSIEKIMLINSLENSTDISIACYGLAFKPNIDDLRQSPATLIAKEIIKFHTGSVLLIEPNIDELPLELKGGELCGLSEGLARADIHLLLVDHNEFKDVRPSCGEVIDTRGIWR